MTCVTTEYTVVNGTFYRKVVPYDLIQVLEDIRQRRQFVYVTYCYGMTTETVRCTVGRSTGEIKIPLEIRSKRSYGGGGMFDDCIIEIRELKKDGGRTLWRKA